MTNKELLTFMASTTPISKIVVDHHNKSTDFIYVNERAFSPILKKPERHYQGLESCLQYLLQSRKTLQELLPDVKMYNFHVGTQYNLKAKVEDYTPSIHQQVKVQSPEAY